MSNSPSPTYFTGYISDLRLIKGAAQYTATFTPPAAPLTAVTNTSLLTSMTNAGISDATAINDLTTVGNAKLMKFIRQGSTSGTIQYSEAS